MYRILVLTCVALSLGACAVGNTYDYRTQQPRLAVVTNNRVALGVLDQRPYVLSNNKPPSFVGLQRGGYGNPWDVNTVSGGPLADDIASTIGAAFKAKNIQAKQIKLAVGTSKNATLAKLRAVRPGRIVLVSIYEWKTDTLFSIALYYDLRVDVYDGTGRHLAKNRVRGSDTLGRVALPSRVGPLAGAAIKRKLERLLNSTKVQKALQ